MDGGTDTQKFGGYNIIPPPPLPHFLWRGIKRGSNSVNTVDRAMILALCTSADGPLPMYQVLFNSHVYFQRYAQDKLFIAKMKKGSNLVNTVERVMVLALCNSPHSPLSVCQVSFNYLQYFEICSGPKV